MMADFHKLSPKPEPIPNDQDPRSQMDPPNARPDAFAPSMAPQQTGGAGPGGQRFKESMTVSFEQWHDGIGYDLHLLGAATPEELREIEKALVSRPTGDWRDVQALAALNSPGARTKLREALHSGNHQVVLAVMQYAPDLLSESKRTRLLAAALEAAEIYSGLTQALALVEDFHPPAVIRALWRGLLERDGTTATHFAAMLMFLFGKAKTPFDWDHRPLFLRFNTSDRAERESALRELCQQIGQQPESHGRKPQP
jgi:hypothetical protein